MIFQLQNLSLASASLLPDCCAACGWWQGQGSLWSDPQVQAWRDSAEEVFGRWGKLAVCDGKLAGMVQFGPATLFPRSDKLASGPVSPGSILLTCSLIPDPAFLAVRKSLVLAIIGDLERDGFDTIEAFAPVAPAASSGGHLFAEDFLRECGFYVVRSTTELKLMRLQLGGIQPVRDFESSPVRRGLLERLGHRSPAPVPAALCRSRLSGKVRALAAGD